MSSSNAMWGGRFSAAPSSVMEEINASIDFDRELSAQDIRASRAHAVMLMRQGIIGQEDGEQILKGLEQIRHEMETGVFVFSRALEDIHMNVEARLAELIGPAAGRLHTARSRNDQVSTDLRLYVRDFIDAFDARLGKLQRILAEKALVCADVIMPGLTHLQPAQPVTFGHHLLAYVEMVRRDRGRFADVRRRANECPLGAAALAGTAFAIDRHMTAADLGFDRPTSNSLDSVSDRDFVLEVLAAASIAAMHFSRFAEEIILWVTPQFRFITLGDHLTTGSSIMPQKRNPDAAELVRAKVGRIVGAFTGLTLVMKALPLAYAKDMQEDKEPLFDALKHLDLSVIAVTAIAENMQPDPAAMEAAASHGFSTATDLADWLVRHLDLPFREAHHVTGRIVALAEGRGIGLQDVPLVDMQRIEPRITQDVFSVLTVRRSVESRKSYGGTSPDNVRHMANRYLEMLAGGTGGSG